MGALSNVNITTKLVGDTIGLGSNNVGALCSGGVSVDGRNRINKWSKYRPFSCPTIPRTDEVRLSGGLSWVRKTVDGYGTKNVTAAVPTYPTGGVNSPYCLGDYRGYNHDAKGVDLVVPNGLITIPYTATSATISASIQYPECLTTQVYNRADAKIFVADRIIGTEHNPYGQGILGSTTWTNAKSGTTENFTFSITKDLPNEGVTMTKDVYFFMDLPTATSPTDPVYFESIASSKRSFQIRRDYNPTPDKNDGTQWRTITPNPSVVNNDGAVINVGITFDSWAFFYGLANGNSTGMQNGTSLFRIFNIKLPITQAGDKYIEYKEGGVWKVYKRFGKNESYTGNIYADGSTTTFPVIKLASGNTAIREFRIRIDNEL